MSDLSYRANEGCKTKDLHTYCGNGYVPPGLAEKGWRIDKSLSTNEQEIWINDKTKETVIANRGTAKLGEIAGPDRCIAMNQYNEKCTGHASRALEVARKVEASYPEYAHGCTGHSLGGSACRLQAERLSMKGGCQLFNPGSSALSRASRVALPTNLFNPTSGLTRSPNNCAVHVTNGDAIAAFNSHSLTTRRNKRWHER